MVKVVKGSRPDGGKLDEVVAKGPVREGLGAGHMPDRDLGGITRLAEDLVTETVEVSLGRNKVWGCTDISISLIRWVSVEGLLQSLVVSLINIHMPKLRKHVPVDWKGPEALLIYLEILVTGLVGD